MGFITSSGTLYPSSAHNNPNPRSLLAHYRQRVAAGHTGIKIKALIAQQSQAFLELVAARVESAGGSGSIGPKLRNQMNAWNQARAGAGLSQLTLDSLGNIYQADQYGGLALQNPQHRAKLRHLAKKKRDHKKKSDHKKKMRHLRAKGKRGQLAHATPRQAYRAEMHPMRRKRRLSHATPQAAYAAEVSPNAAADVELAGVFGYGVDHYGVALQNCGTILNNAFAGIHSEEESYGDYKKRQDRRKKHITKRKKRAVKRGVNIDERNEAQRARAVKRAVVQAGRRRGQKEVQAARQTLRHERQANIKSRFGNK